MICMLSHAAMVRPASVVLAAVLVVAQIVISLVAAVAAWLAPADYRTLVTTTPAFLMLGYAVVAYFLWVGRGWARILALTVAGLGTVGNLSVVCTTTTRRQLR